MHLREEIWKEHSRVQAQKIAGWVGNTDRRFQELLELFLHDEYRVVQRAAWIIGMVAEKHPDMVMPYLPQMVGRMADEGIPVAVKRNVIRILQFVTIPDFLHGQVMDICFRFLSDEKETVAVRCFSMTVLYNLSLQYSEIKQELKLILQDALEHEEVTTGFRARAKRTLSSLKR